MKPPRLYLETSLFGFYHDESLRNRSKREAVRTLFGQITAGVFEASVSEVTLYEVKNSEEPYRTDLRICTPEEVMLYEDR